jgi:Ser-tRNA(Ala) deacylase AlaX
MDKRTASRIFAALKQANVNVSSVSIGTEDDRSTWSVQPDALQGVAQPIIEGYAYPTDAQLQDEDVERETSDKRLQAVALALWECIPVPSMTKPQLRARIKALYKSLP